MKMLKHTNVVELKNCFYSKGDKVKRRRGRREDFALLDKRGRAWVHRGADASPSPQPDEVYLNLVLEFVPETIYRIIKHYSRTKRQVPTLYVKVGPPPPRHCCYLLRFPLPLPTSPGTCAPLTSPSAFSCTCIRWLGHWPTFIQWASAIAT